MIKFQIQDVISGEVTVASPDDACKAMTRLERLRKQRAFLIERLGVFRVSCVTLRVRKHRADAENARLRAEAARLRTENERLRAENAKWRETAERAFNAALRNAAALADAMQGERGE